MQDPRRATPRTDTVLADPRVRETVDRLGDALVKRQVAAVLDRCRAGEVAPDAVVDEVVHTNLGRAPLSPAAVEAVRLASGATDVELDLSTGRRGRRGRGALAALAEAVPEAGGVHVVNNGAAALALVTCALAMGREVIVSRGEMVEIGDGFRIPELLESVGTRLREVGTTNRVRLSDYADAVNDETAFVLKVHPSNFTVSGFTADVPLADLATLPVPVVHDIGSGLLRPHPRLPDEPSAAASLAAGADLVTASGDKLLGGPQCGLMLGRAELVEALRRHPFARAVRVDKLTLAALEATLTGPTPPVAAALVPDVDELKARAVRVAESVRAACGNDAAVEVVDSAGAVGGGGAPGVELPSAAVAVPERLAAALRTGAAPVVGRVHQGRLLLDLLALDPADDERLAGAVVEALGRTGGGAA